MARGGRGRRCSGGGKKTRDSEALLVRLSVRTRTDDDEIEEEAPQSLGPWRKLRRMTIVVRKVNALFMKERDREREREGAQ